MSAPEYPSQFPAPTLTQKSVDYLRLLAIFHYIVAGIMVLCGCFPIFHVAIGAMVAFYPPPSTIKVSPRRKSSASCSWAWGSS
ncbi:hypothetical protein BH09SUM1_BH09SUM1_27750 [soil metagenome]